MVLKQRLCFSVSWLLLAFNMSSSAMANQYAARIDIAEWRVEASPFYCKMMQDIPYYGEAVFQRNAGETVGFYLKSAQQFMAQGKALVQTHAPNWQPQRHVRSLGYVPVVRDIQAISLDEVLALKMLDELYRGMELGFKRQAWYINHESTNNERDKTGSEGPATTHRDSQYGEEQKINVGISPVSFRAAYRQYNQCLAQLLPVNFEQIERSSIYFATGKHELNTDSEVKLEHIIAYLKADPSVEAMFVDGHTDSVGNRQKNVELSKRRAESVSNFLIMAGIGPERITTRFHGERYPVAGNGSQSGRAKNRRVTIRLEKQKPPGLLGSGEHEAQFGF